MGKNFFSDWTHEQVAEHNRRVAVGKKVSAIGAADVFEGLQRAIHRRNPVTTKETPQKSRRGEWVEIEGKRFYARSKWEVQYAFFLQFLKDQGQIMDWR